MTDREHTGIEAPGLVDARAFALPCWREWMPEALRVLLQASHQLLAIKRTGAFDYVYVSDNMADLLGVAPSAVVGLSDADLMDPSMAAILRAGDVAASVAPAPTSSEHRFDWRGERRVFTVWRTLAASREPDDPALVVSLWIETTAAHRREAEWRALSTQLETAQRAAADLRRQLHDRSMRDEATGLYRHEHFVDQFKRELDLSTREHREFSLVSIAIDPPDPSFVDTIDSALEDATEPAPLTTSREARSRVLETLGRLLQENTRAMDASCRIDDEHFTVLLSGVGLATAHARMDGLRRQCAAQVVPHDGGNLRFTVSMGVASFPHTASDQDELVFAADRALMGALARGNHVCLASISLERGP